MYKCRGSVRSMWEIYLINNNQAVRRPANDPKTDLSKHERPSSPVSHITSSETLLCGSLLETSHQRWNHHGGAGARHCDPSEGRPCVYHSVWDPYHSFAEHPTSAGGRGWESAHNSSVEGEEREKLIILFFLNVLEMDRIKKKIDPWNRRPLGTTFKGQVDLHSGIGQVGLFRSLFTRGRGRCFLPCFFCSLYHLYLLLVVSWCSFSFRTVLCHWNGPYCLWFFHLFSFYSDFSYRYL